MLFSFGGLGSVMVIGEAICINSVVSGDVSFSGVVSCQHARGSIL